MFHIETLDASGRPDRFYYLCS